MKNKQRVLIMLACLFCCSSIATFARGRKTFYGDTKIRGQRGIISIQTAPSGKRNAPLRELAFALKLRPKVTHFKVIWDLGALNIGKGLVIYNRTRKTAELFARANWAEGSRRVHVLYSGVTEDIIDKAALPEHLDTAEDNQPDYFGYFDELPKLGCRRTYLSDVTSGNW